MLAEGGAPPTPVHPSLASPHCHANDDDRMGPPFPLSNSLACFSGPIWHASQLGIGMLCTRYIVNLHHAPKPALGTVFRTIFA